MNNEPVFPPGYLNALARDCFGPTCSHAPTAILLQTAGSLALFTGALAAHLAWYGGKRILARLRRRVSPPDPLPPAAPQAPVSLRGIPVPEDPGAGAVILSAEAGGMPPDEKGRFASILLKASGILSANGEGAFCVDGDDVVHAVRSLPLARADLESFASALESLVNLAELWRGHADAFAGVDGELAERAAEEEALNPLFGGPGLIGN